MRNLTMAILENQVKRAVGVVTSTINKLEKANDGYAKLNAKLDVDVAEKYEQIGDIREEILDIKRHQCNIEGNIRENNTMIENFRNLIGGGR